LVFLVAEHTHNIQLVQMVNCPGCGGTFSYGRGYLNHVQFSQNADCAAIFHQSLAYQIGADSDQDWDGILVDNLEVSEMLDGHNHDMEPVESQFVAFEQAGSGEENLAGWQEEIDINELDFNDRSDDGLDDELNHDSEEEEFGDDYEQQWEPPLPESLASDVDLVDELEGTNDSGLSQKARLAAEDAFRKHPIVEKFPDSRAGAPVPNTRSKSKNDAYSKEINNADNPWAPFVSQIDWEVAQWAKLRGPGSTAMSDLLKIDGVST
jgi:hypothetical protein